jgi:inorganic pyrophosphatase
LKPGPNPPNIVYAFIEIPMGSNIKYEMDHKTGVLFVDRFLHTAFIYPFNYGIIPQTWYYDGDPMDIMVLSRLKLVPGCVIASRPIGFVRMTDEAGIDSKVLAVPVQDPYFDKQKDISDVSSGILDEIKHFFEHYKDLEEGKWVKVEGWEGAKVAEEEILESIKLYRQKNNRKK